MKSKILIITLLMLSAIMGFVINRSNTKTNAKNETPQNTSPQENSPNRWLERFYIGAVHSGVGCENQYRNLDSLGFNLWHMYNLAYDEVNGKPYPRMIWDSNCGFPSIDNDKTLLPVDDYKGAVNDRVAAIQSTHPNMRLVTMRPKIEYLCYGQRSDYQCEPILPSDDLWFYAFNNHETGTPEPDNGVNVMHCRTMPMNATQDNPGFVVSGLRANTEQCKEIDKNDGNAWQGDKYCNWLIKPKIKIPQNFPITNPETPVCRVIVIGEDNSVILKDVVITGKYFGNIQNPYNGSYKEEFNLPLDTNLTIPGNWGTSWQYLARGIDNTDPKMNNADIQVYWYGNCDMWIDYVRVDNDVADKLFKGYYDDPNFPEFQWIKNEVEQIGKVNEPMFMKYYIELVEFNNLPCMAYVNSKLKAYSSNQIDLVQDLTNIISVHVPWKDRTRIENAKFLNEHYIQKVGFTQVFAESYPMTACYGQTPITQMYSRIPNTLPITDGNDSILAKAISPAEYDTWLQDNLNYKPYDLENGYSDEDPKCDILYQDRGNFRYKMKLCDSLSKLANIPFIFMPQAHQWYRQGEVRREPTNEEMDMMTNVAVSYGAKGFLYFSYNSFVNGNDYGTGIVDFNLNLRQKNFYKQDKYKWKTIQDISNRIGEKWGPLLLKFDYANTNSVIYNFENERNDFLSKTYFNNIITYKPGSGEPPCVSQNPGGNLPAGLTYECNDDRYIQASTFQISASDIDKYFMIVNRRCSPFKDSTTEDKRGGRRDIRIRFDANSSEFANYKNWKIIDLLDNSTVLTFDKSTWSTLDLGWYMPGEGKLYKIAPVVFGGGTLVADETIGSSINCDGMIYSNGYNLTISSGATITFTDTAGIEMNGGNFTCGSDANTNSVNLVGKDNNANTWRGLVLSNCASIGIYNTNLSKITANDTAKAVLISNCNNINIKRSTFNMGTNAGAIQAVFTENTDEPATFNVSECNFNMGTSGYDAISITSNASCSLPVIIDWCNFSTGNENSFAVRLIGVTGGAVKNSTFVNYETTINSMGSVIDLYGNIILGNNDSKGIECSAGSEISLSPISGLYLGGYNYIKNNGTSSSNIYSINSSFNIDKGQNDFDISDIDNSKHFTGTKSGIPMLYVNAVKNCFHKDSITNIDATHSVVWDGSSDPVNFVFTDYSCKLTRPIDFALFETSGYQDTIFRTSGGAGGGFNPNKSLNIEENIYKSVKDTININLRKRNYLTVEEKAKQLLNQYPDSLETIGMVQKLYMASLNLDSTKIGITKTFLEYIIATNTQNPGLVKRAFYFIQKCKVKLGQYQSALDGFQYIMTQNPYTYEGLVASWDYAATYLLMGSGGSYKGDLEQQTEELSTPADTLLSRMTKSDINTSINTNKTKNTNSNKTSIEQITKTFYEKIKNVTKDDKSFQEAKVKTLEKTIETTKNKTEKNDAVKELATMKQIKELVKLKKPNTVVTHTAIINSDIKKVFGIGKGNKDDSKNNLIPTTYALYQNYPNPFNPSTKIAYDIPRDAKVKLVIYDILGREVKTLVNNEFKTAGKYLIEFNGSYLASGIYFARIIVNEGKDFIAVKKLVLLK